MRLLVTGAAGRIGRAVATLAAGDPTIELSRHEGRGDGDLSQTCAAQAIVRQTRPQLVINAAGATYGPADLLWRANLLVPLRLLDALHEHAPTARLVLVGSAAEYGFSTTGRAIREGDPCRPNSAYGLSKLAAASAVLALAPQTTVVARIFNLDATPYDPRSLLGRLEAAYARGEVAPAEAGAVRDFVALPLAACALLRLGLADAPPPIVNVCTGLRQTAAERLGRQPPSDAGGDSAVGDPTLLIRATGLDPAGQRLSSSSA